MKFRGMMISALMFLLCIHNKSLNKKGYISDLWYLSLIYYLSILFVVTNHIFFITQYIVILLPIVVLITTFLLLVGFLILVHYGLLFDFKSKATIIPALQNLSFYLYLFFLIGLNLIIDYTIKIRSFYLDKSLSSELERMRFKKIKTLLLSKPINHENKKEVIRCNSEAIEHSKLFLLNRMNLAKDYDKISYFNKNNLSKISDFKISCIKKVPETLSHIRKSFKSESEDEKE